VKLDAAKLWFGKTHYRKFNSISETSDMMCGSSNSKGDKTKKSIGGRGIFY